MVSLLKMLCLGTVLSDNDLECCFVLFLTLWPGTEFKYGREGPTVLVALNIISCKNVFQSMTHARIFRWSEP
jgi:hypothetical protein